MLISIEQVRNTLARGWIFFGGLGALVTAVFLATFFTKISTTSLIFFSTLAGCYGFGMGLHQKFRARFGTTTALVTFLYLIVTMNWMFLGSGTALAALVAGKADLRWHAFLANGLLVTLSIVGGMYREARRLEYWKKEDPSLWKIKLGKYVDYAAHRIVPSKENDLRAEGDKWTRYGPIIAMAGQANMVLLFELYGGGRNNAVFIGVPLLAGVLTYLNLKQFGPAFMRLLLVRKLEKEAGRPFVNADYEQIQELRRTFFLSRWLMKDYVRQIHSSSVLPVKVSPRKRR